MATLHDTIVNLIASHSSQGPRMPEGLPDLARRLGVLPVMLDMGGCYAIRPTGEVVSWIWDEKDTLSIENSDLIRNVAFFQGGAKYPPLRPFLPARPLDAKRCTGCDGTGRLTGLPEPFPGQIVCQCGGAGWIPANAAGI
jgi:hypothetical protein